MEMLGGKGVFIWLLIICKITAVISKDPCHVEPIYRKECGWSGILPESCEARGCCFDASIRGVKWCFHKRTSDACNVLPNYRRECGWPGISQQTCEARGCCFNSNTRDAKWCFHKRKWWNRIF